MTMIQWQHYKLSLLAFKIKLSFFFPSRGFINKENIPSGFNNFDECILNTQEVEKLHENTSDYMGERSKPKRQKPSSKHSELSENQDGLVVRKYFYKIFTCSQLRNITSLFLFCKKKIKNNFSLEFHRITEHEF
jgi:hypothetical protein